MSRRVCYVEWTRAVKVEATNFQPQLEIPEKVLEGGKRELWKETEAGKS